VRRTECHTDGRNGEFGTLHAEVERPVAAVLLSDRTIGRSRLLHANTSSRTARALTELLMVTFGRQIVIEDEFRNLTDVDQVIVYGSSLIHRSTFLGNVEPSWA
jgi:hypothetical protein